MARPPASVTTASAAAILDLMVMMVSLWNGCGPVRPLCVLVGPGRKRFNAACGTWTPRPGRQDLTPGPAHDVRKVTGAILRRARTKAKGRDNRPGPLIESAVATAPWLAQSQPAAWA